MHQAVQLLDHHFIFNKFGKFDLIAKFKVNIAGFEESETRINFEPGYQYPATSKCVQSKSLNTLSDCFFSQNSILIKNLFSGLKSVEQNVFEIEIGGITLPPQLTKLHSIVKIFTTLQSKTNQLTAPPGPRTLLQCPANCASCSFENGFPLCHQCSLDFNLVQG